ncbi:MAG: hypothetical protein DRJ60_04815 [Thermoprotei archaeon]|nr:MAG: hypothetical protein DRJ60_04815 [Thermoprotei archaeon]
MIRVRGEAYEALMELSKMRGLSPQEFVEQLLVSYQKSIHDDMLCPKEFFKNAVIYTIELSFCFPYECEAFEIKLRDGRKVKMYIERVPKRYVRNRLPFKTLVTIIIELNEFEKEIIVQDKIKAKKIAEELASTAFKLLKSFIVTYRRVTGTYYNIGVLEPPANLEEFNRRVKIRSVVIDGKLTDLYRIMPVKEDSLIIVKKLLERDIHNKILNHMTMELSGIPSDALAAPRDYFDAAVVSYYREKWNLAVLQSVIAMEAALSIIVFNIFRDFFMKRYGNEDRLRNKYKNARGLTRKISKFLFPLLKDLDLDATAEELRKIMKDIAEIYDLRSSIVHEGLAGDEENAKKSISITQKFLAIVDHMVKSRK